MNVMFYLPSNGGGGGAHSIVQECIALRAFGVFPLIAIGPSNVSAFRANYPELNAHGIRLVVAADGAELAAHFGGVDVVCATTNRSVAVVRDALKGGGIPKPKPAYYVQDYEPLFYVPGTDHWQDAVASYAEIPGAVLFAKTEWLRDIVYRNTGLGVRKVKPSVDHGIYYAGGYLPADRVSISAMIRTKTARRAPRRTARILERIIGLYEDRVRVEVFGTTDSELNASGIVLSDKIINRGPLSRKDVAATLRASDLFLDLSDYQAFGRTGLEGMACGCVPLLPVFGGTNEYARHWNNAILVDTRSDETILSEVARFIDISKNERSAMRNSAIETSLEYTLEKAAFSEFQLFTEMLSS